eukprot:TRINITY_DN40282_c0_g1_i2.p1 TRINITY_DN40282_c0_g1~~TRINITY_DN40282_c0_g1_i2.p1  ORF type:complete len:371 (+),score=40.11 TRINITY_DN40282_c0_g1_i2:133-1245(+)
MATRVPIHPAACGGWSSIAVTATPASVCACIAARAPPEFTCVAGVVDDLPRCSGRRGSCNVANARPASSSRLVLASSVLIVRPNLCLGVCFRFDGSSRCAALSVVSPSRRIVHAVNWPSAQNEVVRKQPWCPPSPKAVNGSFDVDCSGHVRLGPSATTPALAGLLGKVSSTSTVEVACPHDGLIEVDQAMSMYDGSMKTTAARGIADMDTKAGLSAFDRKGTVSFEEFVELCGFRCHGSSLEEAELRFVFEEADADNRGLLSREKVDALLDRLGLVNNADSSASASSTGNETISFSLTAQQLFASFWIGLRLIRRQTILAVRLLARCEARCERLTAQQRGLVRRATLDLAKVVPLMGILLIIPGGRGLTG